MEHAQHIDFFRIAGIEAAKRIAHQLAIAQFIIKLHRLAVRQAVRVDVQRQKAFRRKRQETPFPSGTDACAMCHENRGMAAFFCVERPRQNAADRRVVCAIRLQIKHFENGIVFQRRQPQVHGNSIHTFPLTLPECIKIRWNGQCRLDRFTLDQRPDGCRGDAFALQIRLESAFVPTVFLRLEGSPAQI